MNRGHVMQSSSSSVGTQQMMAAGNPNWSSSSSPPFQLPPSSHHPSFFIPQLHPSYSSLPFLPSNWYENNNNNNNHNQNHELPESWSQFLLGGLVSEDDKANGLRQLINQAKKLEDWEEHMLRNQCHTVNIVDVKQESSSRFAYGFHGSTTENVNEDFNHHQSAALSQIIMPTSSSAASASSPNSSTRSFGMNVLDFSGKLEARHPQSSSECNSSASGGAAKKARVQHSSSSSAQPTFKVRKEKLGDRVTALHQIVSPFGKTDTASVLLEAIGYIRFLHNQIEALSLPYLGSASPNMRQQQQHSATVHGERNCMFPDDPGQLLNDNCMKMKDGYEEPKLDLRSTGLCLVPVSCTMQVGGDNGADYWAPPSLGGGFQ